MEDALALYNKLRSGEVKRVLILVVMEDALAQEEHSSYRVTHFGLNPCCNGRCSLTSSTTSLTTSFTIVLILVVMEDALAPKYYFLEVLLREVLILVVMEDALALGQVVRPIVARDSLNPCCNGRCTRTMAKRDDFYGLEIVLILVVMEDALARAQRSSQHYLKQS